MHIKSKKGQFFLLIAIIICSIIVGFMLKISDINKPDETYETLSAAYSREISTAVNSALYSGIDVTDAIVDFSRSFMKYARSIDGGYGQLIIFNLDMFEDKSDGGNADGENELLLFNGFDHPVNISFYNDTDFRDRVATLDSGMSLLTNVSKNVAIRFQGLQFDLRATPTNVNDYKNQIFWGGLYSSDRKFFKFKV